MATIIAIFVLLFWPIQNVSLPKTQKMEVKSLKHILSKWDRLCKKPIRVFCFHQVSDTFDESTMYREDWIPTVEFQKTIDSLRNGGYSFISLPEAYDKLKHDTFRFKKYAVLTADDGWASLRNILPWLNEQQIPVTLFLNPAYLDGKHFRERETEQYLTETEVKQLYELYPLLTIGSHGWEHKDATRQTENEFEESLIKSTSLLSSMPNYIPFYAYTWGRHTVATDSLLKQMQLTLVLMDGMKNREKANIVHRELLK